MTLIDEWDFQGPSNIHAGAPEFTDPGLDDLQEIPTSPGASPDVGLCSLEPLDKQLARGRGHVTGAAVASECLLVVTSRAVLLRYDFSMGSNPVAEVELSRAPDASATAVRVDATGSQALVSLKSGSTLGSTAEHLFIASGWKKAKPIPKLRGVNISAAAWGPTDDFAAAPKGSSRPVIVGDEKGKLLEVLLDEKEKRDPLVKALYSFEDAPEKITGLEQHLAQQRTLVLVATAMRLYVFVGDRDLEPLFASYPESAADLHNYIPAPAENGGPQSGLLATWGPLGSPTRTRVAWLGAGGLQHGRLRLDLEKRPASDTEYLDLEPEITAVQESREHIKCMAMTEFHYLLLGASYLQVYNRISGRCVQELAIAGPAGMQLSPQSGRCTMLLRDAEAAQTFLVADESLMEVVMDNEEKDLWHAYLQQGNHAMATRYANTQAERDIVNRSEAEAAFEDDDFTRAASLWGRMRSSEPSFEEIALRFVEVGATEALQVFLMARLHVLGPDDKAQATMVASWMVELHLDQINRALLEETPEAGSKSPVHAEALRTFLKDHVEILDVNVTISLLASYGRMDDLMHYATYRQDNETLLAYLLQRGEESRALAVLRRPNISHELIYKFAPALLAAVPGDTIDAWIACKPPLDARRLLPALMNACEASPASQLQNYALRFVEHCISQLQSTDTTLHNLAVSLYSQDADEQRLLQYLRSARGSLGSPLYEPQFALQVARQHSKLNACVLLLCELNLHEDAVALALTFDKAAAIAVAADTSEGDEAVQRKLWLAIARHLISANGDKADVDPKERVAAVVEVLEEAEGRIRIEDVLPLFPDFVTIDAFKAAICASLEDYNAQIEGLKTEMADSTRIADALRKDISALESQAATLDLSELCAYCGRQIGSMPPASISSAPAALPQYYLFPAGNAFHGACLAKEVMAAAAPQQQKAIQTLLTQLNQDYQEQQYDGAQRREGQKVLIDRLERLIADEDPYNGETVVRIISKGFDNLSDGNSPDDWKI